MLSVEEVLELQDATEQVRAEESVLDYLVALVAATRRSPLLSLGVSPRGSLALLRAARARALTEGRDYLVPDDIKELAVAALAHRVMVKARLGAHRRGWHGRRGGHPRHRAGRARPPLTVARSMAAVSPPSTPPPRPLLPPLIDDGSRPRAPQVGLIWRLLRPRHTIWPTRDGKWCIFVVIGLGAGRRRTPGTTSSTSWSRSSCR